MNPRSSLRGRPLSALHLEGMGLERHRNGSPLGGSESAVFRSFLHLLLNYVYVTISSSKKDCSYIIYKFSLLVFPRAVLFGCFLRGRSLLGAEIEGELLFGCRQVSAFYLLVRWARVSMSREVFRVKFLSGFWERRRSSGTPLVCIEERGSGAGEFSSVSRRVETAPDVRSVASADPEQWIHSQEYELSFWKDKWPYRHLSVEELQEARHKDAMWFLGKMGFTYGSSNYRYEGFEGKVLEVGSGPIGFFEKVEGVTVTAQDSLMGLYAENLPFSILGERGSSCYIRDGVPDIESAFDFVVCSNVLDHTADWIQFLIDCVGRLRTGGELLLVTDSRGVPAIGHTQIFSHDQLVRVLELLGAKQFKVKAVEREDGVHCDYRHYFRVVF